MLTPRHLAMFCLTQLAAIALGVMLSGKCARIAAEHETSDHLPSLTRFVGNYGWFMILIPIACVLAIPRHAEDEAPESEPWFAILLFCAGSACIVVPPWAGFWGLLRVFFPSGIHA